MVLGALMHGYRRQFLIAGSAGCDPLPDRKGFRYSSAATSVKLRGEMLVVRVRHRLWGDCRCLTREDCLIFFGLATGASATIICLWLERRPPTPYDPEASARSHRHLASPTWADGQSGRTRLGKDRCVHSLAG